MGRDGRRVADDEWHLGGPPGELRRERRWSPREPSGIAVIATDLEGTVTHWNDAAESLYGWSQEEVIGRPITELTVGPQDKRVADDIMDSVRRHGSWEGRFWVRRRDGTDFLAHVHDATIVDEAGEPVGLVGLSVMATGLADD